MCILGFHENFDFLSDLKSMSLILCSRVLDVYVSLYLGHVVGLCCYFYFIQSAHLFYSSVVAIYDVIMVDPGTKLCFWKKESCISSEQRMHMNGDLSQSVS